MKNFLLSSNRPIALAALLAAAILFLPLNKTYSENGLLSCNPEGVAVHDVARARRDFDVDGGGVKVCVISDSIRHLDKAKAIKPQDVQVLLDENGNRQDGIGREDEKHKNAGGGHRDRGEGTAMLEIVHSIAPRAELMFATKGKSAYAMAKTIRAFGNLPLRSGVTLL